MKKHLLCLTLDTDPDGLNAKNPNRDSLEFEGLNYVQRLPEELSVLSDRIGQVPMTWFVRADGQIESAFRTPAYLLEKYNDFWARVQNAGDEVAWHPHLYRQAQPGHATEIMDDPVEASDELERLWGKLSTILRPTAFRNGEGWHLPETYAAVERLGFACDSTAIPGRRGSTGHPMNWERTPNQPYFPASDDLCRAGSPRSMVELPMNSWRLQAPYDDAPRIRYMNPAVRSQLFAAGLENWQVSFDHLNTDLYVWVMIFHPEEVLSSRGPDSLYSRSVRELCSNLVAMVEVLQRLGHDFRWVTVSRAADLWRRHDIGRRSS